MGKRGPKPKGKLTVINPTAPKRPNPPFGMKPRARNLFKKIVNDTHVEAFNAEAVVMLAAFCDTENQRYLATKKVEEYGAIMQKEVVIPAALIDPDAPEAEKQYTYVENPWYKIMKETAAGMCTLSAKLRASGIKTTKSKPKEVADPREGLMFNG